MKFAVYTTRETPWNVLPARIITYSTAFALGNALGDVMQGFKGANYLRGLALSVLLKALQTIVTV